MRRITHSNGIVTYKFDLLETYPVSVHISTRHGGVSPAPWKSLNFSVKRGDSPDRVRANRQRLSAALGIEASHVVTCEQVHSRTIKVVDEESAGNMMPQADGLVTGMEGLPLSLVFADCVPVVLYDTEQNVLGVCHAGWRGTVQGAAVSTLEMMTDEFGTDPIHVLAGIGPSIGPHSYEVGEEVVDAVAAYFKEPERLLAYNADDGANPRFNLWEANRIQLLEAGVPAHHIEVGAIDTATNTHDFFSHRAEQGQCGLFSMVGWLHESQSQ